LIARRLVTIPVLFTLTLAATALAPVLVIAGLLLSCFPATRGSARTILFLLGYLWCETLGVLGSGYLVLRHRNPKRFLAANHDLQRWWTSALKRLAERLFKLQFHVAGERALDGPAAIVIPRHASTADTIIPMAFYATPRRIRMRYVLKRELLLDPCIDIVGNRLPNLFVDRFGVDSEGARCDVAELVRGAGPDEGVLIYPEGTRYGVEKHQALRAQAENNPELLAQLDRWPLLLPPRLGGTLAMLAANPGKDVVFCAHVGFEGSSHFSNLINGSWISADVMIEFWRVPFSDIPADADGQRRFLFAQWDRMHRWVADHQPGQPGTETSRRSRAE